jgi:Phage tail protein
MKSVFIDDFQIHDFEDNSLGFFLDPEIKGLESPEIRLPSFPRPNSNGAIVPNQLYNARLITFQGTCHAQDVATYRQRRQALIAATSIKRSLAGVLSPLTIKIVTDNDLELQVQAYRSKFDFPEKNMTSATFKLDLLAPDFYLLGQTLLNNNVFVFQGGGFEIPFEIPFDMSVAGATITTIQNDGNDIAYPFYVIHGPAHDATFTNQTTGEDFSISIDLLANEVLEIDTKRGTVVYRPTEDGSPTNYRQYFSGDFVTLQPGGNDVKFNTSDASDTGFISIQYRNSYTGI